MKKNMAGLILVLFAIALFMTGCEKKAQEKEEAQEASARQLVIQKQTQTEIAEKKIEEKRRELPKQAQIEMEVILQKAVEVEQGDTPEMLQRRVMEQAEWVIMPKAIDLIANGKVKVQDGKVLIEQ